MKYPLHSLSRGILYPPQARIIVQPGKERHALHDLSFMHLWSLSTHILSGEEVIA